MSLARPLDQNPSHRLGSGGEEVATTVPLLRVSRPDEPQVRLVDQGGRVERLTGLFVAQPLGRQATQLVVHERQQLARGPRLAPRDRIENARYVAHGH